MVPDARFITSMPIAHQSSKYIFSKHTRNKEHLENSTPTSEYLHKDIWTNRNRESCAKKVYHCHQLNILTCVV